MKIYEVVIIGAGPAGCSCSLFLSQKKIPHIIIEQSIFPRDKICGDAISGKTLSVLNKINPNIVDNFLIKSDITLPSFGCTFVAPNGKKIEVPFKKNIEGIKPPGFVCKRLDFDYELFKLIDSEYVEILQESKVEQITKVSDIIQIQYKQKEQIHFLQAKLIIGADGAQGIVAKQLSNNKNEKAHFSAGLRAYYSNVQGFNTHNFIELHFLKEVLPGYLWIFPMSNNQANVGVGMLSKYVSQKKVNLKKVMLNAIKTNPNINWRFKEATLDNEIKGWGLPLGSKKRKLSGDNFLLLGDAASMIDPFTGEGIGNAMYSGMVAANTIENAFLKQKYNARFLEQYDTDFYKDQWDELKISTILLKLSKYPWIMNFIINKANKNKALQNTIICMFDQLELRAKLSNPLFYLKILFNK